MSGKLPRDPAIDAARGIAIVAIVLGHVLRGLAAAGIVDGGTEAVIQADRLLYTFHLVVFAFYSGLFVKQGVERRGPRSYLWNRATLLLYLYVLWSLLQGLIRLATTPFVNTPVSITDVLTLWIPSGQLWFLPFLLLITTATVVCHVWTGRWVAWSTIVASIAVSAAAWGVGGRIVGTQGVGLSMFFVAGAVLGAERFVRITRARTAVMVGVFLAAAWSYVWIVLATDATPPTIGGVGRTPSTVLLGMIAAGLGLTATTGASRILAALGSRVEWLLVLGRRSLEIYLAHILAASFARAVLVELGITDAAINILAGTAAGVVLPVLLAGSLSRLGFPWLFTSPFTGAPAQARDSPRSA